MKSFSLILSAIIVALQFATTMDERIVYGLTSQCQILSVNRIAYIVLHANWIHISLNLYMFLSLVFIARAKAWQFIASFLVAWSIPSILTSDIPMLGLSVVNFALTGIVIMNSKECWKLLMLNLGIASISLLLPGIAAVPHIYGLVLGALIGFCTTKRFE